MLQTFAAWLTTTGLSHAIMDSAWVWPVAEIVHFIGLSLLIGVAGAFDLRLLGLLRPIPLAAFHRMTRWAVLGFAANVVTGLIFFIGTPLQYIHNTAFHYKMGFVALAGLNAMLFETRLSARTLAVEPGGRVPLAARAVAGGSLASWLLVLYWGRMLAFSGDAF